MATAGAATVIASRNVAQAANALGAKGLRASSHLVDVTSRTSVQALLADVLRDHGRVDILVNSAADRPADSPEGPAGSVRLLDHALSWHWCGSGLARAPAFDFVRTASSRGSRSRVP